ncbi:MAG TPA: TMEM175 family protein, partial [Hanamia sp.]|nr:TMEM175 family protein [Hanamia sp.]
ALKNIAPSIFAFLLSFAVVLITWVNHHNHLKLVDKSCSAFLYANGFLLLTVAFIPFPTSLLGEYLLTDHAAPAVILYEFVLSLQAIGWILISQVAVKAKLAKSEKTEKEIHKNGMFGYFACALYALCAILAIWFPLTIAAFTTLSWIFWLIFGINIKPEKLD